MIKEWQSRINAKKYEEFSEKYPTYKRTSKMLVDVSGIKKGMTVVDLACGTGTTTLEILRKIGPDGRVVCLDASREMIFIAKRKIRQRNVSFVIAPAENIDKVLNFKADAVLCNAAFWQMDKGKVLASVRNILKKDGRFVFNIGFVTPSPVDVLGKDNSEITKFFSCMKPKKRMTIKSIRNLLADGDFRLLKQKSLIFFNDADLERNFFKIPIMTHRVSGIDYKRKVNIIDRAFDSLKKSTEFSNKWVYFVTKDAG
jgi:ubiquinone/menaquinone biosynthesis C-methylase UbiE